ncbi:MAG: alpha/beta fold hydrolase [Solirubrobacteraceae bacterium]|nr:alpha/beta fold hydrolase [Solirubrobacteraceae bacterium]
MPDPAEQIIRFCRVDGHAVAFATVGTGPPLLVPGPWIGHVELDWTLPHVAAFLRGLARTHTVIRYDRLGVGLSDRDVEPEAKFGSPRELAAIAAILEQVGATGPIDVFGVSAGCAAAVELAAAQPALVRRMVLFGGFVQGELLAPADLRDAMLATVHAHWGAGSRVLADVWLPGADTKMREAFSTLQRMAATPEVAAANLATIYRTDLRDILPSATAPALVLHRRDDRAAPFAQGRDLAARLPNAQFIPLDGAMHPPWLDDREAVLREMRAFLTPGAPADPELVPLPDPVAPIPLPGGDPLSEREREVLRLVAEGMNDGEIAERLVVSPHTVHRHVANIRTKLGQSSRAAAAAHAARHGLI